MATYTPILHLPEVAPNQNQKEDTINTALAILESAMNNVKAHTLAGAGPLNLTEDDYTRYFLHSFSGQAAAYVVAVPAGQPRWFAVENDGNFAITFKCYGAIALTLEVPAGKVALVVSDGENLRTVVPQDAMGLLQDLSDVEGTPTDGQLLRYNATTSKWSPWSLVLAFTALTDAPNSYSGAAGKIVAVNPGGTGLEFVTSAANVNSFVDLDDTPNGYVGTAGYYVKVSGGASGLVFERSKFTDSSDTPSSYGLANGKFLRVNAAANAVEFGDAPDFLDLPDTPDSYTGQGGKFVSVKADGTGLEFNSGTGGPDRFITLLDTPSTYTGQALRTVRVNEAADALEFFLASFLSLSDTPDTYAAQGGKLMRVNAGGTGMEFSDLDFEDLGNVEAPEANQWLRWNGAGTGLVNDTPSFLGLNDTPNAYVGNEGKFVYVKGDGTGLGFTATSANLSYLELTDTVDTTYAGKTGMSPIVTIVGGVPQLQLGYQSFVTLVGGPGAFTGQESKLVAVKADASGLEYIAAPASTLEDLSDVTVTDPQDGQGLVYYAGSGWINEDLPEAGGGTGVPSNGSHLFWRLLLHATDGSTTRYGIQEIEFKRTKTGADLSVGGTASASSTSEGSASGAFDDVIAGAWFSATDDDGEWIKYAFTAPAEVRYLTLMGSQTYPDQSPSAFSVQWSDDDSVWTTAWEVTGQSGWAPSQIREFHAPLDLFFTDLADVPQSYIGQGLKSVRVNAGGTALEFFTPDYGPTTLAGLTDVDIPTPTDGQVLSFDEVANAWVALTLSIPAFAPTFRGEWTGSGEIVVIDADAGVLPSQLTPDASGFTVVSQPDVTAGTTLAIKTRPIAGNGLCYLEQTANFVSDTPFKVRYKVSSEPGFDFFRVLVDGAQVYQDSGTSGVFEEFSTTLTGIHTIRYQYSKDGSGIAGDDCTYISQISYKQVLAHPFVYSDTVTYGGLTYFCLMDGTIEEPGTGTEWIAFDAGSAGTIALADLTDVEITTTPSDGQVLTWDDTLGKWIPATPTTGVSTFVDLTDTPGDYTGDAGKQVRVNATEDGLDFDIICADFGCFIAGKPLSGEKVVRFVVATPFTVLTGTHQGSADAASTASKVFSFTKNGTQFLTATFAVSGTVATFSANVETAFVAGDVLTIIAPAAADATLADISFTLKGRR